MTRTCYEFYAHSDTTAQKSYEAVVTFFKRKSTTKLKSAEQKIISVVFRRLFCLSPFLSFLIDKLCINGCRTLSKFQSLE